VEERVCSCSHSVLGACCLRLRVCVRVHNNASGKGLHRWLCCCWLISAVVLLSEVNMHMLQLAERGVVPGGWIPEIVARQTDLLSRAGKGA
jgi:hypothetical protein